MADPLKRSAAARLEDAGNEQEAGDEEPVQQAKKSCNAARPTQLTVVVTRQGAAEPIAGARIVVTNADGSHRYTPDNAQTIDVAPDTYTIRAYADWHMPAPAVVAAVVVVEEHRTTQPIVLTPLAYHLHVDADRDGVVDADRGGIDNWRYGSAGGRKGAVILCNNDDDDDDGTHQIDHADREVNAGNDHLELAPVEIRRTANLDPPAHWQAQLEILGGRHNFARVFDSRLQGTQESIGPAQGATFVFPNLNANVFALGVEALSYATGPAFDGLITLRLTVGAGEPNADLTALTGNVLTYTEDAQLRVAPWMIPSHLVAAEKIYAADLGGENVFFLQTLDQSATAAGIPLDTSWTGDDIWLQDCMELGEHSAPHAAFRVVNQAPRARGLAAYPRTLLGVDLGYVQPAQPARPTTFDSTGNLEVTPPLRGHDGVSYPFGRIYYCRGDGVDTINQDFERFLHAQVVQAPLQVDTSFLQVGHVDELISFVPAPGHSSQGFKLILASPRLAYRILMTHHGNGRQGWPVLRGRTDRTRTVNFEMTVGNFLLRDIDDPTRVAGPVRLLRYNLGVIAGFEAIQEAIDRVFSGLIGPLGLAIPTGHQLLTAARIAGCPEDVLEAAQLASVASGNVCDVIEAPVVFTPNRDTGKADGLTVDIVNMVVVNGRCIVPMAFGPTDPANDVDSFEAHLENELTALGLAVDWINTWHTYHLQHGGAHCGSNTLRQPAGFLWWLYPNA